MLTQYCEINGFIRIDMILFNLIIIMKIVEEPESKIKINGTIV